ncbi:hypothetical protein JI664_03505 [Rhodobacter sp. NTK016B]|uniref:hypothetical protein n=1 Tax=Rhodobacter sp. NTK016B TaxID=2759676 RepID=UPI001A8E5B46|nr:hypothetical protein [Rhodobacter sp. NTK016B]MBN8291023.1 hypothetical protein [Rhodobacter sp. NTK016B]
MINHAPTARRSFAPLFPGDTAPADLDKAMLEGAATFHGDPKTGIVRMVVATGGARVEAVLTPDLVGMLARASLDAMRAALGQPSEGQAAEPAAANN